MKVFILKPNENWIVDRFADEFSAQFPAVVTMDPTQADVIWLMANWCWTRLPSDLLSKKRVLTSVHHIVPEKMSALSTTDFNWCDKITTEYHVPCIKTMQQIESMTKKSITPAPFWVNGTIWNGSGRTPEYTQAIKVGLKLNTKDFLIGSFQRDTEGHDLMSPKLEKGPDLFCDAVEKINVERQGDVTVVLAGWRRQYVISRLKQAKIKFVYLELPSQDVIRDLYSILDLYVVAARYEGGPQAILECAAMGVPIVSRDVGIASEILAPESVGDDITKLTPNVGYAAQRVNKHMMPRGFDPFMKMLQRVSQA